MITERNNFQEIFSKKENQVLQFKHCNFQSLSRSEALFPRIMAYAYVDIAFKMEIITSAAHKNMVTVENKINKLIKKMLQRRVGNANPIQRWEADTIGSLKIQAEYFKKLGMAYRTLSLRMIEDALQLGAGDDTLNAVVEVESNESLDGSKQDSTTAENKSDQEPADNVEKKLQTINNLKGRGTELAVQLCFIIVDFFFYLMSDLDQVIEVILRFKSSLKQIMDRDQNLVVVSEKVMALLAEGESEAMKLMDENSIEESIDKEEENKDRKFSDGILNSIMNGLVSQISVLGSVLSCRECDLVTMNNSLDLCSEALNSIEKQLSQYDSLTGKEELIKLEIEMIVLKLWIEFESN